MAKYRLEFKLQIVTEYPNGKESYESLAKKHSIPSKNHIYEWVTLYKAFGVDGPARTQHTL